MELEIEIKKVPRYEVKIQGVSIGEFEKTSAWEGMVKFESTANKGSIIVDNRCDAIDNIFNCIGLGENLTILPVIKITPSLIPTTNVDKCSRNPPKEL